MDVNTSKQNAEKIIVTIFTGEKIVKLVSLAMFGTLGKIKKKYCYFSGGTASGG